MFRRLVDVSRLASIFAIATVFVTTANAQETGEFVTTYLNGTGQRLTVGYGPADWTPPLEESSTERAFEIAAQNNVCVSLLRTQQFKSARVFCQRALDLATLDLHRSNDRSRVLTMTMLAAISSNLGVVNALTGNASKAAENFNEARWLDPGQRATKHNLSMLGVRLSTNAALLRD